MDFGLARVADDASPAPEGPPRPPAALVATGADEPADLEATPFLAGPRGRDPIATPTAAAVLRDKITATGALLGTPAYMSPEQFEGLLADARSDQFSFCVALWEALFGTRPFAGRTLDELAMNVRSGQLGEPPASRRVPSRVRQTLERGLRAHPQERFPTMNALLAELEKGAGGGRGGFAAHAAAKLAGVWEAPVGAEPVSTPEKEAIRGAFLATGKPYAAASFASASATLDRYTQRWSELYVEVCEATHVRGEQSAEILDLRMAVLNEGLEDLKALCRLFREATEGVVSNADKAASALANLERCQDLDLVRNAVRPPQDFDTRRTVEGLQSRLAEVRAFLRVGRPTEGLRAAAPLVDEARRVGYEPLLAEALLVRAHLEYSLSQVERSIGTQAEAFSIAQVARHDAVAAEAAMTLMNIEGSLRGRFDASDIWDRNAEALLRRIGSNDLLWGWYFNNRSSVRQVQGRLAEAIEDAERSIDFKTRVSGPQSFDVALSIMNLANHHAYRGDFEAALTNCNRALSIFNETLGADHPSTAQTTANYSQYLFRLGRFEEAREAAGRALAHIERESDPGAFRIAQPLRTLGLCELALGRAGAALPLLERAVAIRDAIETLPLRLAEVHFPLARALYETGARKRALALARQARGEYERAARTPLAVKDLAEVDLFLATHDRPAKEKARATKALKRKAPAKKTLKQTRPGSRPKPRRASRAGRRPSSRR
jgi:tetratricopeptide (TPR) repeat protein